MGRGEKREGVRQGRPMRRMAPTTEILREADRIIKEKLKEKEKEKGRALTPFLAFICGMLTATAVLTAIQIFAK